MNEPLALLLLPGPLEGFELESHARGLLSIPRVLALEASRLRAPRFLRDAVAARQAARLRLPGLARLVVLYGPENYPLARAFCSRYGEAELWYVAPDPEAIGVSACADGPSLDDLARERAAQTLSVTAGSLAGEESLRARLQELGVISPKAFVPGASFQTRMPRKG